MTHYGLECLMFQSPFFTFSFTRNQNLILSVYTSDIIVKGYMTQAHLSSLDILQFVISIQSNGFVPCV